MFLIEELGFVILFKIILLHFIGFIFSIAYYHGKLDDTFCVSVLGFDVMPKQLT